MAVVECILGVHSLTFHRCRAASPDGQYFYMNECSVGQVMKMQSAEAGYSVSYNPNANPPQCPGNDCTRPIQRPFTFCDGRRSCFIAQSLLIYPRGSVSALCNLSRDGNFIRIRFTCVSPTGTVFHTVSVLGLYCIHIPYVCMYLHIGPKYIYAQGSVATLCALQRDANFIKIKFICVTGMIFGTCCIA